MGKPHRSAEKSKREIGSIQVISLAVAVLGVSIALLAWLQNVESSHSEAKVHVELNSFFAKSIDLRGVDDVARLKTWGLTTVRPIVTRYWRSERSKYTGVSDEWYLYALIENRGPGIAQDVRLSDPRWVPRNGSAVPDGLLDMEGALGILKPGEAHALLVDVAQSYDPSIEPMSQAGIHFEDLSFTLDLSDATGATYHFQSNEGGPSVFPNGDVPCASGC